MLLSYDLASSSSSAGRQEIKPIESTRRVDSGRIGRRPPPSLLFLPTFRRRRVESIHDGNDTEKTKKHSVFAVAARSERSSRRRGSRGVFPLAPSPRPPPRGELNAPLSPDDKNGKTPLDLATAKGYASVGAFITSQMPMAETGLRAWLSEKCSKKGALALVMGGGGSGERERKRRPTSERERKRRPTSERERRRSPPPPPPSSSSSFLLSHGGRGGGGGGRRMKDARRPLDPLHTRRECVCVCRARG